MARAVRRAIEYQQAAALEGAVDDSFGEMVIVQHAAPGCERRLLEMAVVRDVKEHVRGIDAIGQIADLIHHEYMRMLILGERLAQPAGATPPNAAHSWYRRKAFGWPIHGMTRFAAVRARWRWRHS